MCRRKKDEQARKGVKNESECGRGASSDRLGLGRQRRSLLLRIGRGFFDEVVKREPIGWQPGEGNPFQVVQVVVAWRGPRKRRDGEAGLGRMRREWGETVVWNVRRGEEERIEGRGRERGAVAERDLVVRGQHPRWLRYRHLLLLVAASTARRLLVAGRLLLLRLLAVRDPAPSLTLDAFRPLQRAHHLAHQHFLPQESWVVVGVCLREVKDATRRVSASASGESPGLQLVGKSYARGRGGRRA